MVGSAENFTLEILEYCPDTKLLEREQFYLDLLLPEYNVLKHAYSLLGYKHSPENIEKFKSKIISPDLCPPPAAVKLQARGIKNYYLQFIKIRLLVQRPEIN